MLEHSLAYSRLDAVCADEQVAVGAGAVFEVQGDKGFGRVVGV